MYQGTVTGFPKHCPRCGSRDLRDIVYGGPDDPGLLSLWSAGDVMIRARRSSDGKAPGWMCAECGLEMSDVRTPRPLPPNRRGRC